MLYDQVLQWFGKRVFGSPASPAAWGDVKPGDILAYYKKGYNHVAYISTVNKTAGIVTSVVIETKDGREEIFTHKIGLAESFGDPLTSAWGEMQVYHLDLAKIRVSEVSRNCDCESNLAGFYRLDSVVINPYQLNIPTISISKEHYSFTPGKDDNGKEREVTFNFNTPPGLIKPKTSFILQGDGTSNTTMDHHLFFTWEVNGSNVACTSDPRSLDVGGKIGNHMDIVQAAKADFNLTVPDVYPEVLCLTVRVGYFWDSEPGNTPLVQYFYRKIK